MINNMNAICIFDPKSSFNSAKISGSVTFHQCPDHISTLVTFALKNFTPFAKHGIHIHKLGVTKLEGACDSTCDHYNPYGKEHGSIELYGTERHAGDLINNILADDKGEFHFQYEDELIDVSDIMGRSIVIHSGIDDLGLYRNNPSNPTRQKGSATTGNAGSRIACSVIGRA